MENRRTPYLHFDLPVFFCRLVGILFQAKQGLLAPGSVAIIARKRLKQMSLQEKASLSVRDKKCQAR